MIDLQAVAAELVLRLRENDFPEDDGVRQVLCVAEEAGEFVGAYRRWKGWARRSGPFADVEAELADVILTSYVTAAELGIDLDAAIERKLDVVRSRGYRERK